MRLVVEIGASKDMRAAVARAMAQAGQDARDLKAFERAVFASVLQRLSDEAVVRLLDRDVVASVSDLVRIARGLDLLTRHSSDATELREWIAQIRSLGAEAREIVEPLLDRDLDPPFEEVGQPCALAR